MKLTAGWRNVLELLHLMSFIPQYKIPRTLPDAAIILFWKPEYLLLPLKTAVKTVRFPLKNISLCMFEIRIYGLLLQLFIRNKKSTL